MTSDLVIEGRYGPLRIIDGDLVVSEAIRRYGEWAGLEIELISRLVTDGDVVADVGAFIGTHARAFSNFVGAAGLVYAFEPRREVFEILLENCQRASYQNIAPINRGLGSRRVTFVRGDDVPLTNAGAFSLYQHPSAGGAVGEIKLTSLDDMGFTRLDFIKIDVEGMEREVLDGGVRTMRQLRPIVHAEVNSLHSGVPLLDWCQLERYAMYCSVSPAFNPANYLGNSQNMFGDAAEVGALLIPVDRVSGVTKIVNEAKLIPIATADDLVNVMLSKPQYWYDVLQKTVSASYLAGEIGDDSVANSLYERGRAVPRSSEGAEIAWHANLVEIESQLRVTADALKASERNAETLKNSLNENRNELNAKELECRQLISRVESLELELRALRAPWLTRFFFWLGSIRKP